MATLPFRLDEEGFGYELFSAESGVVKPLLAIIVDIGITVKVPRGYYGRICHRAGLHMETVTATGDAVDRSYKSCLRVVIFNFGQTECVIAVGDDIGQLIVQKCFIPRQLGLNRRRRITSGPRAGACACSFVQLQLFFYSVPLSAVRR